ncbi:MAG: hypothetical protein L3J65_01020 [Robiginitomaculum sp.]|nr:hypothetical protein [Robiginitomaculum sp.]
MVLLLLAILALYFCIAIFAGLHSLVKNNNADAPVFQLLFAIGKGLSWPLTLRSQ